ncbi:hypothetical protein SEA_SIXAMA_4 [Gordonia phage Sixama]|uniref:Uncharacterized protein n=1 Tax=Gordonia phage Sixama TaxID=2653271 RepID=A0A5Q2F649_9CAUD|nr:hypothetical protein PP302_gp004 [Gordonia phage Sixama]QGF20183.1 hypothetical protein SEA_SIXAMA_4 [Gordonia phage Sixama]
MNLNLIFAEAFDEPCGQQFQDKNGRVWTCNDETGHEPGHEHRNHGGDLLAFEYKEGEGEGGKNA